MFRRCGHTTVRSTSLNSSASALPCSVRVRLAASTDATAGRSLSISSIPMLTGAVAIRNTSSSGVGVLSRFEPPQLLLDKADWSEPFE